MPSSSHANIVPVRANPALNLVGDEDDVVLGAPLQKGRQNPGAGTMKPPSPRIGSMMIAARLAARSACR